MKEHSRSLLQCLKVLHKSGLNLTPEAGLLTARHPPGWRESDRKSRQCETMVWGVCCPAYLIIPGLWHLEVPLTLLQDNEVRQLLEEPSWWPIKMLPVLTNN